MANVTEVTSRLNEVSGKLDTAVTALGKISVESSTTVQSVADLKAQIEQLQNQGTEVPAELLAALERVENSTNTVASAIAAVDELVPDATTPAPGGEEAPVT